MHTARMTAIPCIFFGIFLIAAPCAALYDFEGLALRPAAHGEVRGAVITAGTYGLTNPPAECTITLDRTPVWARIYGGMWGGTEKYSGWARFTVNGQALDRITLSGEDDRNEGVYCSGHGVYWIATDATALLGPGENTVSIATSKGEAGSKIDGRLYGVMVVASVENDGGDLVRYVVLEGNENLHGEGWAGTNPTCRDRVEVPIEGMIPDGMTRAELSVFELATGRGQPDYLLFNGADLGGAPVTGSYLPGARDIGNERSFDAAGGTGTETRYVDIESFDVTAFLRRDNVLVFERGRDLDGDGAISTTGATPEGEDYMHPCLAILTITRTGSVSSPLLSVDPPEIANAYAGEEAVISVVVRNAGSPPAGPVTLDVMVDDVPVESRDVLLPPAGWARIAVSWKAAEGMHDVAVTASAEGAAPAGAGKNVQVGTPVDIAISISQPVRQESAAESGVTTPVPLAGGAAGAVIGWWLFAARSRRSALLLAGALIIAVLAVPLTAAADSDSGSYVSYILPVEITNTGGSDAPAFEVDALLDGERVTRLSIEGVPAGGNIREQVPIHTAPGSHRVSVIADEKGVLNDHDRTNNRADGSFTFP
ncbi:MAG: DUF3344 domain-containing protein [Methanomicrobiaceae archaeon]|nr:DUF3344 domain-containing protein [Methanomicrobiaceae archaeon]